MNRISSQFTLSERVHAMIILVGSLSEIAFL